MSTPENDPEGTHEGYAGRLNQKVEVGDHLFTVAKISKCDYRVFYVPRGDHGGVVVRPLPNFNWLIGEEDLQAYANGEEVEFCWHFWRRHGSETVNPTPFWLINEIIEATTRRYLVQGTGIAMTLRGTASTIVEFHQKLNANPDAYPPCKFEEILEEVTRRYLELGATGTIHPYPPPVQDFRSIAFQFL